MWRATRATKRSCLSSISTTGAQRSRRLRSGASERAAAPDRTRAAGRTQQRDVGWLTVALRAAASELRRTALLMPAGTSVRNTDGLVRHRCLSWPSDAVAQRPVATLGLPARVDFWMAGQMQRCRPRDETDAASPKEQWRSSAGVRCFVREAGSNPSDTHETIFRITKIMPERDAGFPGDGVGMWHLMAVI